jgi:hypothetical protein
VADGIKEVSMWKAMRKTLFVRLSKLVPIVEAVDSM